MKLQVQLGMAHVSRAQWNSFLSCITHQRLQQSQSEIPVHLNYTNSWQFAAV